MPSAMWSQVGLVSVVARKTRRVEGDMSSSDRVIQAYNGGRQLSLLNNRGTFPVEWHLAGDLKVLMACNNIPCSPNAKFPGLYDDLERQNWGNGRPGITRKVDPAIRVFSISLERTHICTLHARMRIAENLLNKIVHSVWTVVDSTATEQQLSQRRAERLQALCEVLNEAGVHGGHVEITEDPERKGMYEKLLILS